MKSSTSFVVAVVVLVALWLVIIAFLKAATSEPRVEINVLDISEYRRGDIVTNAAREVYVVKTVRAPHTLVCVRKD